MPETNENSISFEKTTDIALKRIIASSLSRFTWNGFFRVDPSAGVQIPFAIVTPDSVCRDVVDNAESYDKTKPLPEIGLLDLDRKLKLYVMDSEVAITDIQLDAYKESLDIHFIAGSSYLTYVKHLGHDYEQDPSKIPLLDG